MWRFQDFVKLYVFLHNRDALYEKRNWLPVKLPLQLPL